jgi:hypothetical protein
MPEIKGGRGVTIAHIPRPSRSRFYLPRLTIPRGRGIPRADYASKQARKEAEAVLLQRGTARHGTVISLQHRRIVTESLGLGLETGAVHDMT